MSDSLDQIYDSMRIGHGYDLHRLSDDGGDGAGVSLAGVRLDCPLRIEAHSDGDVVIHSLIDAILGALALGDIGDHFPDSDPAHLDRPSASMLTSIRERHIDGRWRLINADATLVCERPRIAAHRESMRQRLADLLAVDIGRISLKATTNEQQDSIGAGRAIACHAVALLGRIQAS